MDELNYVLYARAFGWTPEQVDALPISLEPYILPIDSAIGADIKRRQAEAENKAAAKHGKHRKQ